jgi:hypothetical protein
MPFDVSVNFFSEFRLQVLSVKSFECFCWFLDTHLIFLPSEVLGFRVRWCGGVVVWWCGGVVVWWCGGVVNVMVWWCRECDGVVV